MILRTTTGRSFKGVGQYVLHDKGAQTNDRVSFVETENLVFSGDRAIAEMVHTAVHQKEIKRRAGLRATQTSKPVYHLSLSWDTSENPSLKEQMDAARSSLKALGLDDHQTMIVGHTDTDNPHVHVVVNLVNPTTGKTASLSNDQVKLSKWAEQYRRDRGEDHFCPQRKKNNDRRAQGEFVKADNLSRPEYEAWKKSQTKEIWDNFRADRANAKESRKGQFDALWERREAMFAQRKEEIKATFKPKWSKLYKDQRTALRDFDAGFFDRLGFALSRRERSKIVGLLQALTNDGDLRNDFIRKQDLAKKELGSEHKARVRDASRQTHRLWQIDRDALKEMHQHQDEDAYKLAKEQSAEVWKDKDISRTGQDFEDTADRRKDKAKRQASADNPEKARSQKKQEFIDNMRTKRTRSRTRTRTRRPR